MQRADAAAWLEAENKDIKALKDKNVLAPVEHNPEDFIVPSHFVYKSKRDGTYKVRLVIDGHRMKRGVHFDHDTFSPVASYRSVRIITAIAAHLNWHKHTMDVRAAYLNASNNRRVIIRLPFGFPTLNGSNNRLGSVLQALYGDPGACKLWYADISGFLQGIDFTCTAGDPCLFYLERDGCNCLFDELSPT